MADGGVPLDADGDGEVDGAREADLRQGQQDGHQVGVPVDTADPGDGHQYNAVDIRADNEPSAFAKFIVLHLAQSFLKIKMKAEIILNA